MRFYKKNAGKHPQYPFAWMNRSLMYRGVFAAGGRKYLPGQMRLEKLKPILTEG